MFNDKDKKDLIKKRAKLRKHAIEEQVKYDAKRKRAERIKDEKFVAERLEVVKEREEKFLQKRDALVKQNLDSALGEEIKSIKCKNCKAQVSLSNLTCPACGQLYCQYCGAAMDMMNPGKCPRCGGAPYYTPAKLVLTKVEDLPPEERFWEELPNCPKCGAAVQSDWDDCPFCNTKLTRKTSLTPKEAELSDPTEVTQPSGPESAKDARRRIREERKKKSISGI